MKIIISYIFVCLLIGCTSYSNKSVDSKIKDQKLSTDFSDEGIKITYTLLGNLEKIEVFGQADAWKQNVEAIAEADALAKLNKFINGSNVNTERHTKIIGQAIENAKDSTAKDDSNLRVATTINDTTVSTITSIISNGKLIGVNKTRDFQKDNGKLYVAVYQWSEKDMATADFIRNKMNKK
jgi:hypothetical protein